MTDYKVRGRRQLGSNDGTASTRHLMTWDNIYLQRWNHRKHFRCTNTKLTPMTRILGCPRYHIIQHWNFDKPLYILL